MNMAKSNGPNTVLLVLLMPHQPLRIFHLQVPLTEIHLIKDGGPLVYVTSDAILVQLV